MYKVVHCCSFVIINESKYKTQTSRSLLKLKDFHYYVYVSLDNECIFKKINLSKRSVFKHNTIYP